MKLNLLPQTLAREKQARVAMLFSLLVFVVCVIATVFLIHKSQQDVADAKSNANQYVGDAQLALTTSQQADATIAASSTLITETQLAQAMLQHNYAYPSFYDSTVPYIPSFFRITTLQVTPIDGSTATVTMSGTIKSFQQYADLMLALMRDPQAISVSRAGFNLNQEIVPALTATDQVGEPRRPNAGPVPQSQVNQIDYYAAQVTPDSYENVGNFGTPGVTTKGAMPGYSFITIQMVVRAHLETPDPRATLGTLTGGGGAAAGGAGPGGPAGPPGIQGFGPPAGFGNGAAGGGGGQAAGAD